MALGPYEGPWRLTVGGDGGPSASLADLCGELYAVLGDRTHTSIPDVDATPLWKVGAMMHHLAAEDRKTADVDLREAFAAYKRGEGPDPRLHPADQQASR